MKVFIIMLCFLLVGCVTVPSRDALYGLPVELRNGIQNTPIFSGAGTRNSSGYRYGSPENGFLNINSNRGYTTSEYNSTDGHGWSLRTSGGRVTGWSVY